MVLWYVLEYLIFSYILYWKQVVGWYLNGPWQRNLVKVIKMVFFFWKICLTYDIQKWYPKILNFHSLCRGNCSHVLCKKPVLNKFFKFTTTKMWVSYIVVKFHCQCSLYLVRRNFIKVHRRKSVLDAYWPNFLFVFILVMWWKLHEHLTASENLYLCKKYFSKKDLSVTCNLIWIFL